MAQLSSKRIPATSILLPAIAGGPGCAHDFIHGGARRSKGHRMCTDANEGHIKPTKEGVLVRPVMPS